jgi:hypothetical protein
MTKPLLILILVAMTLTMATAQTGTSSKAIRPSGFQKKIGTVVSGKTRNYYALSTSETSMITVQGPGTLKVNTRGQFRPGENATLSYTVLYTIDGGVQQSKVIQGVGRSKKAVYQDATLGVPGELSTFEIQLSRGYHNIEFRIKENTYNAAARYIFTPAKLKKQEWLAFSPMLPSVPVDLISRETNTLYYRFSMEKPLRVEIIGPSELRVLTRTENHYQMKGRINYRVQVRENGSVINTYQLFSSVSDIAVYKDEKNLIPGTACEFVIYVPKGTHIYEISPMDKDKGTLLGRLLIPVKDVKPEK